MKKLIALLIAIATCFGIVSMAGCNVDPAKDLERIEKRKYFVVGYTDYDPFAFTEGDKLVGFDIELAEAVADLLEIDVKFQLINWNKKVTEIKSGNIDVIWNAMTITDELKKQIDISDAYVNNNQAVVVKSGNETQFATKEALLTTKIALEDGSSAYTALKADATLKNVETLPCEDQLAALQEVAAGTSKVAVVDVLLYDSLKAKASSIVNSGNLVKVTGITFPPEQFGIGFRKGSPFKAVVEDALDELKENGTYAQIAAKYNMTSNLVD